MAGCLPGRGRIRGLLGVLSCAAGTYGAPAAQGAAEAPSSRLRFSGPVLIDHRGPFTRVNYLTVVSCPTAVLCVAMDIYGNVLTSTDPTAGAAAWSEAGVDGRNYPNSFLEGVACPSASLCVAVDGAGNVVTSTDPTGGPGAWTVAKVTSSGRRLSVSCASSSQCVVTDDAGDVFTSTDPVGGPAAWMTSQVGPLAFTAVSCPSTSLCVAVDG